MLLLKQQIYVELCRCCSGTATVGGEMTDVMREDTDSRSMQSVAVHSSMDLLQPATCRQNTPMF